MARVRRIGREFVRLLRNWRFYVGAGVLYAGIQLNFASQVYLHRYLSEGHTLPVLSDVVLEHLPLWHIAFVSDLGSAAAFVLFIAFVLHRDRMRWVPYFLLLCGVFNFVRPLFVVLTPLSKPEEFAGTGGLFNGFSKFELGVYPSGHTGITFMYFALANDRWYRAALGVCLLVVIGSLFVSRSHYSIDVLSGIFFAYAIRCYGDRYWQGLVLPAEEGEG